MDKQTTWNLESLEAVGGHALTVHGRPRVVETAYGKAVEFDGARDGIFIDCLPVEGWREFTIETLFYPAAGGLAEQRFIHMQEAGSENRIMFETRLTGQSAWYADTFMQSGTAARALIDPQRTLPTEAWYSLGLTCDGREMRQFVNGRCELSGEMDFSPLGGGTVSIGVRGNLVCWFKGIVRTVRFSPRVLRPEEMLKP